MMKKFSISIIAIVLTLSFILPLGAGPEDAKKGIPDYSLTPRKDVPVEYTWKVEDIFPSNEAWEKEKNRIVEMTKKIDLLAGDWTSSAGKMLEFLELMNEINKGAVKLFSYANLQAGMDMGNQVFQQMKGQLQMTFVQLGAKIAFINDDILELGKEKFTRFLKEEPGLEPYALGVEQILRMKEHVLPKDQQKIATMTGLFAGASQKAAKMLNDVEIPSPEVTLDDGTKVVLNFANFVKYRTSSNIKDRRMVMQAYWNNHKKFENTLAVLLDAGIKQDLFNARIHNYKDCLEARLYGEDIDPSVYLNLIKSVRANLAPLHRYLNLKKELLGIDKHLYEDIYASAVKAVDKEYSWEEAQKIILQMMKPLGKEYVTMLQAAFANRWIDRYPNQGKESGAYSSGVYGVHPFIKMNYNGSYDTLSTLAHELGHAMHSYFSQKTQHYARADYSSFMAEIASTFNENMLLDYLLKTEKDDLFKLFLLDSYLNRVRSTVFRQTLFAEFELEMHRRVEAGQSLTAEWLNKKYLDLTRTYYGHDKGVMNVGEFIQNEWSSVPHFYYNYYVFTYSTGIIASQALTEMVLSGGKKERERYLEFLKAGGNGYPIDVLKIAGVDMTTTAPADAAFKRFEKLVGQMEEILSRLKKKGIM